MPSITGMSWNELQAASPRVANLFARSQQGMKVEDWMLINEFGMLQQLGIIPR